MAGGLRQAMQESYCMVKHAALALMCSHVNRPYAEAMASLLDPEDRVFGGRIIAAGGGVDGPDGPTAMHNKRLMAGG